MTEIAKAYVQLIPTTEGIGSNISSALDGEMETSGSSSGSSWSSKFISIAKTAIAAAGIGKLISSAISEGADYEQNIGGIETLFGEGASTMVQYANEAYQTAGLSANDYMETVTGFAASLKQSVGGDMEALTSTANQAVIDMADNANKMGTDMESIQNAYQGFAKQNYTMLDNLKLGYGGTKSEMERLLEDASEISGIEYNIDNLDDVYNAIHVIQEDLGITNATADEALTTVSGSVASLKAAWTNALTAISTGGDISGIVESLGTSLSAVLDNLLPMLTNVITQLVPALSTAIVTIAPALITEGTSMVTNILTGIAQSIPELVTAAISLVEMLSTSLMEQAPTLLQAGLDILTNLISGLIEGLPDLINAAFDLVDSLITTIIDFAPEIIECGVTLLTALVEDLPTIITTICDRLPELLDSIMTAILEAVPEIIEAGVTLLTSLVENMPTIITTICNKLPEIITNTVSTLAEHVPEIIECGVTLLTALITNLPTIITTIVGAIPDIITSIISGFGEHAGDMADIGKNLLSGIASGITGAVSSLASTAVQACKDLLSNVKSFFGIKSPSRVMAEVGGFLMEGMANGIEDNAGLAAEAMDDATSAVSASVSGGNYNIAGATAAMGAAAGTMAAIRSTEQSPIYLTVQSLLDGKIVSESVTRYQRNAARAYG